MGFNGRMLIHLVMRYSDTVERLPEIQIKLNSQTFSTKSTRAACAARKHLILRLMIAQALENGLPLDTTDSIIPMTKADKLVERLRSNPRDWRMESLVAVARRYGIEVRKTGGSHFIFLHADSEIAVSIPFNRPIKPVYIAQFLALIDDIGSNQ